MSNSDPKVHMREKSESEGKQSHPPHHHLHTSSIEKAHSREDFNKFFSSQESFSNLSQKCLVGEMKHMKCRWTAWRAFLGMFEIGDESKIRAKVKHDRDYYHKELDHYMNFRAKQKLDIEIDNPLSTNQKNPWNSFFEDNELKLEIRKDVERTYQDIEFFYTKSAQDLLTNILFIWCKHNPDLSYRQGMNEIAGVLTYVCFTENYAAHNPNTDLYDFLNDEKQAEADIYAMFKKIMELNQKEMFRSSLPQSNDPKSKKKPAPKTTGDSNRPNLPVVHRAAHIQEELLPRLDSQLANHLQKMSVEPQVYMIRWIRCMLSREYRISQALVLWDALFSYYYKNTPKGTTLEFLDYICLAMLLHISDQLLEKDDGGSILGRLIKYPPIEDETAIMSLAYEFIEPLKEGKTKFHARRNPFAKNGPGFRDDDDDSPYKPQPEKKVVLFNPEMPILKNTTKKEELFPKASVIKSTDPFDPLAGPFGRGSTSSTKKPANEVPASKPNLFEVKKQTNEGPFGQGKPIAKTISHNPFAPNRVHIGGDAISSEHLKSLNKDNQKKLDEEREKKLAEEKEKERKAAEEKEIERKAAEEREREQRIAEEKERERKAAEEKEKQLAHIKKIEEENEKAIKTITDVIELIKQENEKNNSSSLEDALTQLNNTLESLKSNSNEIQLIK